MMPNNTRLIASAALVLSALIVQSQTALSDPGHSHNYGAPSYSAGRPGDPKKPARIVLVTMRETSDGRMIYEPRKLDVKRGEQVRFILTNVGEIPHEFVIASAEDNLKHAEMMKNNPDMKHEEPNVKMLDAKKKAELVWQFSKPGTFEFACLIPGHREAGMTGTIVVR